MRVEYHVCDVCGGTVERQCHEIRIYFKIPGKSSYDGNLRDLCPKCWKELSSNPVMRKLLRLAKACSY